MRAPTRALTELRSGILVASPEERFPRIDPAGEPDDFLLREGLDLLAAFRAIRSFEARKAILIMIAAVAQAERDAEPK